MLEGSKAHSKGGEGLEARSKEGRVRKHTNLGMRNDRWWKNIKIFLAALPFDGSCQRFLL